MRVAQSLLAIWVITVLSSCATVPESDSVLGTMVVTPGMVLEASPLGRGVGDVDFSQLDLLEMTPEISRSWTRTWTALKTGTRE